MSTDQDSAKYLRGGRYPSQVARSMGISTETSIKHLRIAVGHGTLRLSDLYFSWPSTKREVMQKLLDSESRSADYLAEHELDQYDLELFAELRQTSMFRADMYDYVSRLELSIHELVRECLVHQHGLDNKAWWRQGVPLKIRQGCAARNQEDIDPIEDLFSYTMLMDLHEIINGDWGKFFVGRVPDYYRNSRPALKSDFNRLNRIRNAVMHPIRDRRWREEDFEFVLEMFDRFNEVKNR